jgi:hypothetical protein
VSEAETIARWLLAATGIYLTVGLAFALAFVLRGARRIDPRAAAGSWGFRLAILPGVAALWPILARRWLAGPPPPEERNAHRDLAAGKRAR